MAERGEIRKKGNRQFNSYTQGSISAGREKKRAQSIVNAVFGRGKFEVNTLEPGKQDVYGSGKTVSIEKEAGKTKKIQNALDDEIERENRGETPTVKGLPPCLRVKKEG